MFRTVTAILSVFDHQKSAPAVEPRVDTDYLHDTCGTKGVKQGEDGQSLENNHGSGIREIRSLGMKIENERY